MYLIFITYWDNATETKFMCNSDFSSDKVTENHYRDTLVLRKIGI